MPKDAKEAKKIRRIVKAGGVALDKVYKPGQEDALAKVISKHAAREMIDRGELDGDWSDAGEAEEPK